ncbi:ROK family protein [Peribacillus loiseleuriae]|uniref:ROK family protein n=1 Tax=Peribacillus loiseleuriae TaxID=1679170 RepID=UPI0038008DA1
MYLVFDIGGTYVKYALIDRAGKMQTKNSFPTPESIELLLKNMTEVYKENVIKVKGIAISCPGTVDVTTGVIYHGGALSYLHKQNLVELLKERCKIPITVENDAKSAALAELWLGSVKGHNNAIVLVLGSHVGGGIIIDGKIYCGKNLSAGEVSYVMNHMDASSLKADFLGFTGSAVMMVKDIAKKKGVEASGHHVFDFINKKDPEATVIFEQYCLQLAIQILNFQYIFDPDVIAIGGGISAQPIVVETIREAIDKIKINNPMHNANPTVVTCKFQNDANLFGALYNFFEIQQEKSLVV